MAEPADVTTDGAHYEENSESVELWSPGNLYFAAPELLPDDDNSRSTATLKDLLEE